jgi:hypothetical protein
MHTQESKMRALLFVKHSDLEICKEIIRKYDSIRFISDPSPVSRTVTEIRIECNVKDYDDFTDEKFEMLGY